MLRNHLWLLVLGTMLLGLSACGPARDAAVAPEEEVSFPDSNLETAVRYAIRKYRGPIYTSDVEEVASLSLAGRNVADLTGLEHFVNLQRLDIHDTRVRDLSPLASLKNLTELTVEVNQIADMSALDGLTDLVVHRAAPIPDKKLEEGIGEALGITRRPLYVSELERLISLSLAGKGVTDLTGIEYCANLERIELQGNQIDDLSPLAALDNLADLVLGPKEIRALPPLDFLTDLTLFEAVAFPDQNLEAAIRRTLEKPEGPIYTSDLEGLTSLSLARGRISNLTGLEYAVNLETLELNGNSIVDMSPLAALTNLKTLIVDAGQIQRASAAPPLTGVEVLEIVDIPDRKLEAALREAVGKPEGAIYASDLEKIESFAPTGIGIADLTGLEHARGLTELYLDDNEIRDIAPLAGLSNLSVLSLRNDHVRDIAPLAELSNLSVLTLSNNLVRDLTPLARLSNLTELYADGNEISSIPRLVRLSKLAWLDLSGNQIHDVSPLVSLIGLTWLSLYGNPISDVSPLASLSNLSVLVLEPRDVEDTSLLTSLADTTVLLAVSFPDPKLEAAIREAIAKPEGPIYTHELKALTALSLSGLRITDLTGLEYCTSLKRLDLHDNRIKDISPLASLTSLTRLYLYNNRISDISPLASLTNLADLRLHENLIEDIEPLVANGGLSAADTVTLADNPLSAASENIHIPTLEKRGVSVSW